MLNTTKIIVPVLMAGVAAVCVNGFRTITKLERASDNNEREVLDLEQSIGLKSVDNARELGGYVAGDGRRVRHGVLLRAGMLSNMAIEDVIRLKDKYHLSKVIDFRMKREVDRSPDYRIDGVKNVNLRIIDEALYRKKGGKVSLSDILFFIRNKKIGLLKLGIKMGLISDRMYVDYLSTKLGKENYRRMFEEILDMPKNEAVLLHCTQGKDRTGLAAMLILSALGVDEKTIMKDYLLTNKYNEKQIKNQRKMLEEKGYRGEELDLLMTGMDEVNPKLMKNAFDWMKEEYGSVNGYITEALGITEEQIEKLKEYYLV